MGTSRSNMDRTCTGDVCVRMSRCASGGSTKKVSCISRAGWSGLKLRASKLNHSDSTSGPSAISQPMPTKMSATRSCSVESGCPAAARSGGDVNGFLDEDPGIVFGFEHCGPVGERLVDPAAGSTHQLSGERLLVLGQAADLAVGKAERGLLTA